MAILVPTTRHSVARDTQATADRTIPIRVADIRSNVHTTHRNSSVHTALRSSSGLTARRRGRILRRDRHHSREAIQRREATLVLQGHPDLIRRRVVPIPRLAVLQAEPLPAAADHHLVAVRVVAVAAAATAAVHTVVSNLVA